MVEGSTAPSSTQQLVVAPMFEFVKMSFLMSMKCDPLANATMMRVGSPELAERL
jgi:hypothetical protein